MATVSASELTNQVTTLYTGTDYFYGLLVDATSFTVSATTTLVEFVTAELSPSIGDYVRQEFFYTGADVNAYSSGVSLDAKRITFTYGGSTTIPWTVTHLVVLKAPSLLSSSNVKPILSSYDQTGTGVDLVNNRITVSDFGNFNNGDKVIVQPETGVSLPAGIAENTIYYIKTIPTSQIELYSDEALTSIVDITGTSTGTGYIKNLNGSLFGFYTISGATQIGPTQSVIYDVAINQGV